MFERDKLKRAAIINKLEVLATGGAVAVASDTVLAHLFDVGQATTKKKKKNGQNFLLTLTVGALMLTVVPTLLFITYTQC